MKRKPCIYLYGLFQILLAAGAIITGIEMILSSNGLYDFMEYPTEWYAILPFKNWLIPGIIAIALFGAGNIAAAIGAFSRNRNLYFIGTTMGCILLISTIIQIQLLGTFLISYELIFFALIQLILGLYSYIKYKINI